MRMMMVVLATLAFAPITVVAQNTALPTIADAPAAAKLLSTAADQAKFNKPEAARALRTVLDDWGSRVVSSSADPELFVSARMMAEQALFADTGLLAAFRQLEESNAQKMLQDGQLDRLVATRLATMAGMEAALQLAQRELSHARIAAASNLLARLAPHDGLVGKPKFHHAAMQAIALARLGDARGARAALERCHESAEADGAVLVAAARADVERAEASQAAGAKPQASSAPPSAAPWAETWRVALQGAAQTAGGAMPATDGARVYADDGAGMGAWDRLSGRPIWFNPAPAPAAEGPYGPSMHYAAPWGDALVYLVRLPAPQGAANPNIRIRCCDSATGMIRWERAVDISDGQGAHNGADAIVPVGAPVIVDGQLVVAARRLSAQLETVSWLFAFSLSDPAFPAWSTQVATVGSQSRAGARAVESPVIVGDSVYLATGTGTVGRFDAMTGATLWLRRFHVPDQSARAHAQPWDVITPAVAGGRVFALTPDLTRIAMIDVVSGALLQEIPCGADTPFAAPRYLTGLPGSSLVAAVGDTVVVFDAATPAKPSWAFPAHAPLSGRVTWAAPGPGRGAALVIPVQRATLVCDGMTGQAIMQLPAAGNSILTADQFITASSLALSSFMSEEEALRQGRARLSSDTSVDAALSFLDLARRTKRASAAAEAALEAANRLRIDTEPVQNPALLAEALDLLLYTEESIAPSGPEAATFERLIDAVAIAAGQPQRAALARADRLMRQQRAGAAAALLADLLLTMPEPTLLDIGGVTASLEAHALDRLRRAATADLGSSLEVQRKVTAAVRAGVPELAPSSQPADPDQLALLRASTRVAHASGASPEAMAPLHALLERQDPSVSARMNVELKPRTDAPAPRVGGQGARIVEFPGEICPLHANVRPAPGSVVTAHGSTLAYRTAPAFAPAWQAEFGSGQPQVLSSTDRLLLWIQRQDGKSTALSALAATGNKQWETQPAETLLGPVHANDANVTDPDGRAQVELQDGRFALREEVLTALCTDSLVLVRRDGAAVALDANDGTTQLWQRPASDTSIVGFLSDARSIVIATADRDEEFVVRPRIAAFDGATGAPIVDVTLSDGVAPELQWMRVLPGGMLVIGTESGIQARRLAGGDESLPFWTIETPDVQYTTDAWPCGPWLLVQTMRDELLAVDPNTGRIDPNAFHAADAPLGSVRDVQSGPGWVALVRDSVVDFFTPEGAFLGRDVAAAERLISLAVSSHEELLTVDARSNRLVDEEAGRFDAELFRLAPMTGGKLLGPPVALHMTGRPISAARALDGWILLSNGAVVQAIEFGNSAQ